MKQIELTQGEVALVDDADYDDLMKYKWCLIQKTDTLFYACRNNWYDGKSHNITMHQQILGFIKGMEVDHRDGNGLDNRRSNLRHCTHQENTRNQKLNKNNKCGFKGVYWGKALKKWRVAINVNGEVIRLGGFFCVIKAARAYDAAAKKYFGEYARLNNA